VGFESCSVKGSSVVPALTTDNRPDGVLFPPQKLLLSDGIKLPRTGFNLVWISGAGPQSDSFEDLAMPLFDQLYNFARWLTQNREEAEDLVQETYAKALKGFSSFQLGTNFRAWMYRILRNTFLTSGTGLRAASTVPVDSEDHGPELAVENETPEIILMRRSSSQTGTTRHRRPAGALPGAPASLRGGGNVTPGDCGDSFHSDRHGNVSFIARQTHIARPTRARIAK
jgi:hypothetical protein